MAERLTKKYSGGYGLVKVKDDEQAVDSQYPNTLRAILETFKRLGEIEDILYNPDGTERISLNRLSELVAADKEGRINILPCKPGTPYAGICCEMKATKRGWKTERWIETGVINKFELTACMTASKAGYDHSRPVDELGEIWFIGDNAKFEAQAALNKMNGGK